MSDDTDWESTSDRASANRAALGTMRQINQRFANYNNGLQRMLNGDPYAGMSAVNQLSLVEDLERVAQGLRADAVARLSAVDVHGAGILSTLEGSSPDHRVPLSSLVERGAPEEVTLALKELIRLGLIDFAVQGAGAGYWITDTGTVALSRRPVASSERPATGGGVDGW